MIPSLSPFQIDTQLRFYFLPRPLYLPLLTKVPRKLQASSHWQALAQTSYCGFYRLLFGQVYQLSIYSCAFFTLLASLWDCCMLPHRKTLFCFKKLTIPSFQTLSPNGRRRQHQCWKDLKPRRDYECKLYLESINWDVAGFLRLSDAERLDAGSDQTILRFSPPVRRHESLIL